MGRMSLHQHTTWPQAPQMRVFIFALEHRQGWNVQQKTHAKTERRSCRLILPSPMLLRCSFAVPKLASTYNRAHGTMKEGEGEGKGEQSAGWSHYNASTARRFVITLVPCPLP